MGKLTANVTARRFDYTVYVLYTNFRFPRASQNATRNIMDDRRKLGCAMLTVYKP